MRYLDNICMNIYKQWRGVKGILHHGKRLRGINLKVREN